MKVEESANGYDIIGDVHGCADTLCALLEKLGYQYTSYGFQHPESRKAVFVGDLVDRGPKIRDTLSIVRAMVENEVAYVVLGNHEFNALTFCSVSPDSQSRGFQVEQDNLWDIFSNPDSTYSEHFLRKHTPRNRQQVKETLDQFECYKSEWLDYLSWFRTLPIYLEFPNFRVVHACWDVEKISYLKSHNPSSDLSNDDFFYASADWSTMPGKVVDRLIKGTDMKLPDDIHIMGSDGVKRSRFRTKFWAKKPTHYKDVVFQPDALPEQVAETPLNNEEKERLVHYKEIEKPVFVGHYWCAGKPKIMRPNLACLDYSAVKKGKLVAYQMDGESELSNKKFVWVDNTEA